MLNGEKKIARPLRWGMIGGGRTGQVGYKHRTGALRDNTTYESIKFRGELRLRRLASGCHLRPWPGTIF